MTVPKLFHDVDLVAHLQAPAKHSKNTVEQQLLSKFMAQLLEQSQAVHDVAWIGNI